MGTIERWNTRRQRKAEREAFISAKSYMHGVHSERSQIIKWLRSDSWNADEVYVRICYEIANAIELCDHLEGRFEK